MKIKNMVNQVLTRIPLGFKESGQACETVALYETPPLEVKAAPQQHEGEECGPPGVFEERSGGAREGSTGSAATLRK
jgi:hypothetical protein